MNAKFYKNEKFQVWFYPILYFCLTVAVVITACFIFNKKFYQPIVITGKSMWPTLAGARYSHAEEEKTYTLRSHYGIADVHRSSVNELRRFDVVITYYPDSWGTNSDYKIKRLWGLPGETITMTFNPTELTYTFTAVKLGSEPFVITSSPVKEFIQKFETAIYDKNTKSTTYEYLDYSFTVNEFVLPHKTFRVCYTNPDKPTAPSRTTGIITDDTTREFVKKLDNNEYFVMGDNWRGSSDSSTNIGNGKLTYDFVQGRVICIDAYTTFINNDTKEIHNIDERYEF